MTKLIYISINDIDGVIDEIERYAAEFPTGADAKVACENAAKSMKLIKSWEGQAPRKEVESAVATLALMLRDGRLEGEVTMTVIHSINALTEDLLAV